MALYVGEFEWDDANELHILERHRVTVDEVEQCFYNRHKIAKKPKSQDRYYLWGRTDGGRRLFIVFQYRGLGIIRPISARDMDKGERAFYDKL